MDKSETEEIMNHVLSEESQIEDNDKEILTLDDKSESETEVEEIGSETVLIENEEEDNEESPEEESEVRRSSRIRWKPTVFTCMMQLGRNQ